MAVTLKVYDDDLTTLIGTLTGAYNIGWLDERLGIGTGSFTVAQDDTVVAANPTILGRNNFVQVLVDGTAVFGWLMRRRTRSLGDTFDPIDVSGPGITEILSSAVVYPAAGLDQPLLSDTRVFGWMSADYDDSSWEDGTDLSTLGTQEEPTPENFKENPPEWPDPEAEWIWTQDATGDPLTHPEGTCYFRRKMQISDPDPPSGPARIYVSAVNRWAAYFDATELGSGGSHQTISTFDVELVDGIDHVIAFKVTNADRSATYSGQNVGGLLVTVRMLDSDDEPGDVVYRSFVDGGVGPTAGRSPGWKGLDYPSSVPGVTPGYILKTLFDEAQARGALDALTVDFTATVDSAGNSWTDEIEFACQVGNDNLLSVAERLRHYGIEFNVTPGLVFQAWDSRGTDRGGTPDGGASTVTVTTSQVTGLQTSTEDEDFNALLVRSADTWLQRPDPGPSSDRREGFLSLGLVQSSGSAADAADDALADFNNELEIVTFGVAGGTGLSVPIPTVDFDVADVIQGPWLSSITGSWASADVKVDSVAGMVTETGDIDWSVEVSAP